MKRDTKSHSGNAGLAYSFSFFASHDNNATMLIFRRTREMCLTIRNISAQQGRNHEGFINSLRQQSFSTLHNSLEVSVKDTDARLHHEQSEERSKHEYVELLLCTSSVHCRRVPLRCAAQIVHRNYTSICGMHGLRTSPECVNLVQTIRTV
ncbi:hypothetical protein CBL_06094 [Carabus blaptoides fortunei]